MKKIIVLVTLLLTAYCSFAQHYTVRQNSYNQIDLSFKSDQIQCETVKTTDGFFTKISMDEYMPSNKVGYPELPVLSKLLEIPLCDSVVATVSNAVFEEFDAYGLGIKHPIYPVQTNYPKTYTGDRPFDQNKELYRTNAFYAEPLVQVKKIGTMRDITMANICVSPVQYNPVTNKVRVYRSLDVTVSFVSANIPGTYELKSKYGSPAFQVGAAAVINPMERTRNEFSGAPIKYLIVANSMFQNNNNLNQFIAWKKRIGYIVEVAYTSDPNVGTTFNSIKSYIQAQYTNATTENPAPTFLLLIGDVAQLPPYNCPANSSAQIDQHVSDLYYATWTSGDILPDCYYGRFSAQNISQLTPQIDKTLTYEQFTMEDPSYLGKAVLIAGTDATWAPTHADGQINYIYNNYINTNSTTHNYTTVYKHNYDCNSQAATIRNEIGAGVGWANYTAHGSEDGWYQPAFNNSHVSAMQNEGKYGIMIGNCCLTGKFDNSSDCFAETLLRTANKGAVAYIGGSEVTYWPQDYYWAVGARSSCTANPTYDANNLGSYDRVFHTHGENAGIWTSSISAYMQGGNLSVESSNSDASAKQYYWEIYHVFGDPSIRPYQGIPTQMNVLADDMIMLSATSYQVTSAPYAYVALTFDNELITAAFADANGEATLTLPSGLVPGEYELAVGAQNKIQYFKTVTMIVPQGAFVVATDVDLTAASTPDAGSTVNWDLSVKNMGVSTANNAYAKMTTSTPGVTILTDSVYIGTLSADATQNLGNAFRTSFANDMEDATRAIFTVTVYWGSSSSSKNILLNVNAPRMVVESHTVQAPNNASAISPGDLITVNITNKNAGHANLAEALVDLTSNYTGARVITSSSHIHNLGQNQTSDKTFSVQIASTVPDQTLIPLCYHIIYNNRHETDTIFVAIGNAVETFESGNFSQFPWVTNTDNPWEITTYQPYAGTHCARSKTGLSGGGWFSSGESSTLEITLNASQNGNITYFRRVSSEQNYDKFYFYIDGAEMESQSGTVNWGQASFPVEAGIHTYKFEYSKDRSVDEGSDCAWIDNIVFPGMGRMAPQDTTDDVSMSILDHNITTANIAVYPNPTSGQLTVSSNEAIRNITIYDLSGRLVESVNVNADTQVNLNVARLNSGIYFIKTQLENQQTRTSKFIKQ